MLEQALDSALQRHRLTLLVAPAGYGKTAALTRQIRRLPPGCALAWLSADEDDHLQRFLACLTTALEPHDLPWRVAPDALGTLALAERGVRAVADELVNAFAAAERVQGLIVIDDAHRIADPKVFELLQAVLERLPEQWGLAIASRTEPPLSLARWRARGELVEFRQPDLRFNRSETDSLLASLGAESSGASAQDLLERTEGWAAGLRLSLSARPGGTRGAGSPTQRHLFDYLASEVLDDMPAELRQFLLRCAVLPELTAPRCAQVSQMPQAAQLLEEVERRGLFVAVLDAAELTLRLHDLFRDFLEDRLQREHPEDMPGLLRRAAEGESDLQRAVGYLLRAGAWGEAAQALEQRGPLLVTTGGGPALEQMLAQFPAAELAHRPGLQFLRGLTAFQRFDFDAQVACMQRAAEGFEKAGQAQPAALASAYACCGMLNTTGIDAAAAQLARLRDAALDDTARSFVCFASAWAAFARLESEDVAPHFAAMLDALERANDVELWDRCFYVSLFAGLPGMRPLLERFAAGATRLGDETPTQLRAGVLHIRAGLALARGDVGDAASFLARADEDCRWLGRPRSVQTENWMAHTLVDAVRGDRQASYAAARANHRDMQAMPFLSNRLAHEYEEIFTYARAAWLLGDAPTLRALDAELARAANAQEWAVARDHRRMSRAFVALLDERLEAACELLQPVAAGSERSCFHPAAQARLMLADARLRLGRVEGAADLLRPWCEAAHVGGDVGGALLAGAPVLQRLAAAPWGDRLTAADQALIARLARSHAAASGPASPQGPVAPAAGSGPSAAASPPVGDGLSTLTQREREVLARMAAGDSNKLIARAFDLSPHTVKRHVANILDKLGVDTRGRAAARWRERGPG